MMGVYSVAVSSTCSLCLCALGVTQFEKEGLTEKKMQALCHDMLGPFIFSSCLS